MPEKTVGIRELKARLSAYIQDVKGGQFERDRVSAPMTPKADSIAQISLQGFGDSFNILGIRETDNIPDSQFADLPNSWEHHKGHLSRGQPDLHPERPDVGRL